MEIISKNYLLLYFLLFHKSKEYLKCCLEKIKEFLQKEKLVLNGKTRIYKSTNNFIFLGRNKKGKYARYRTVHKKLKRRFRQYDKGEVKLCSLTSTIIGYKFLCNKDIII